MHTQGTHNTQTDLRTRILTDTGTEKERYRQRGVEWGSMGRLEYSEKRGAARRWKFGDSRRRGMSRICSPNPGSHRKQSLACVSCFIV